MIPTKLEDLKAAGYVFDGEGRCRGCGAHIEWFITPAGKRMPMTVKAVRERDSPIAPILAYERISHFSDCPNAKEFRK